MEREAWDQSEVRSLHVITKSTAELEAEKIRETMCNDPNWMNLIITQDKLAAELGISKVALRQALKLLEIQGVIEVKPGRSGGVVFKKPGHDILTTSLQILQKHTEVSLNHILQCRYVLELAAIKLAAENITPEDISELEHVLKKMKDASDDIDFLNNNLDFHLKIVNASHNPLLSMLISAFSDLIYVSTLKISSVPLLRGKVLAVHANIFEALKKHDQEMAAKLMDKHLRAFNKELANSNIKQLD